MQVVASAPFVVAITVWGLIGGKLKNLVPIMFITEIIQDLFLFNVSTFFKVQELYLFPLLFSF